MQRTVTFLAVAVMLTTVAFGQSSRQERTYALLKERYEKAYQDFAAQMQTLAAGCEQLSFLSDAERIRQHARPVESGAYDIDNLPDEVLPEIPPTLPDAERGWRVQLQKLQADYAMELYKLSRDALRTHPSLAFTIVREVAFRDPNHEQARKLLGYVRDGDRWTTPYVLRQERRGYVDHPQFGWINDRYVDRYENGERLYNGKWISQEQEAAFRRNFQNAWEVESEHFFVRTNHSLEKGVDITRQLEIFHRYFVREFAAMFNTPQQMRKLFNVSTRSDKLDVIFFKNREEFIAALKQRQPGIEIANGLYMPSDRCAYFFFDENVNNTETMFHEVTHQILSESSSAHINDLGKDANFWLVEGIACYMESAYIEDGKVLVGDPTHERIHGAKHYLIQDNFYVPLSQLTAMGQQAFQGAKDIATLQRLYAQSTAMAHFFLHYEDGIYRDDFIQHMAAVYSPSANVRKQAPSIESLTGVPFPTLDQQYRSYVTHLETE